MLYDWLTQKLGQIKKPRNFWLVGARGSLALRPYISLRRCTVCERQDLFLFDWRKLGNRGNDNYGFIDYLGGHAMDQPWHQDEELHAECKYLPAPEALPDDPDRTLGGDYIRQEVQSLLEGRSRATDYESPAHLRKPLRQFIETHDRGVFWLQAPAHVGKTVFVQGLEPSATDALEKKPLLEGLVVVAFFIRREYQYTPASFEELLWVRLREALGLSAQERSLPRLVLAAADPAQAFANWLAAFFAAGKKLDQKLLVCIDGLDELPISEGRGVADFLPRGDQLDDDVYLLLTSRPPSECSQRLQHTLQNRYADEGAAFKLAVSLDDPGYRALLRRYFDHRLAARRSAMIARGQIDAANPAAAFDQLFAEVIVKAEGRFLYVSYLTDLLADHQLKLEAIDRLPPADALFAHYLGELKRIQSDKQYDLTRRLLLHLAAAEDAFNWDNARRPALIQAPVWQGLPLHVLSGRVEGNDGDSLSSNLVYTLYTLKAVLASWRGDDRRHARFRLGLKGLADIVRDRWGNELTRLHARLVDTWLDKHENRLQTLAEDIAEINALDPADRHLLRYLGAHAALANSQPLTARLARHAQMVQSITFNRADHHYDQFEHLAATRWYTHCTNFLEALRAGLGEQWSAPLQNDLANVYMNRGVARRARGDLSGAVADYDRAIELQEALRAGLGEQWSAPLQNDLARVYNNRGNARRDRGDLSSAVADYDRAIGLQEALRAGLGEQWSAPLQNDLAGVYMNRGNARGERGDLSGAVADYDRAITIWQSLHATLAPHGQGRDDWQGYLQQTQIRRDTLWQQQQKEPETRAKWRTQLTQRLADAAGPWPGPPLLTGAWEAQQDRAVDTLLAAVVQSPAVGQRLRAGDFSIRGLRTLSLAFYNGWRLWEIWLQLDGQDALLAGLTSPADNETVILDGQGDVIHALNQRLSLRLTTDDDYLTYTRFFCAAIKAGEGRLQIVEAEHDMPWLPGATSQQRQAVAVQLQPLRLIDRADDQARLQGNCLYGAHLFRVTLVTSTAGRVVMEEDEPLAEELPVRRERFDGPFRLLANPEDPDDRSSP